MPDRLGDVVGGLRRVAKELGTDRDPIAIADALWLAAMRCPARGTGEPSGAEPTPGGTPGPPRPSLGSTLVEEAPRQPPVMLEARLKATAPVIIAAQTEA